MGSNRWLVVIYNDAARVIADMKSKRLYARARDVIASGVNSPVRYYAPYPFFVERANAGHIWDADSKRYVDLCCAYGALLLGHRNAKVISAVSQQMKRGTLYCAPTEQETELAELISGNYASIRQVRLVNTGMEATMAAIRLARAYTGRQKIVKFDGGYHGAHDYALVHAGSGVEHLGIADSAGSLPSATRSTRVAKYNDAASLERVMSDDVAAVIIEPVMANMGLITPKRGFLKNVVRAAHKRGALVIFDETVTGFRMARGGAQEYYGVNADITTLGKALGGGFAIGAIGASRKIMGRIAPDGDMYLASTFAGNPVSVSASIAAIRHMRQLGPRMYSRLERTCGALAAHIGDVASDLHIPHTVNHVSSMMQMFLTGSDVTDSQTARSSDRARFTVLAGLLREHGVFVPPSQFEVAFLSTAHTEADIAKVRRAYERALGGIAR